jgi:hypothetical protein
MLEATMRANIVLAMLAGLSLSIAGEAMAEAKNLSCISGLSPNERRLLRDCGPESVPILEVEIVDDMPPPPPPTALMHEGGRKADKPGRDRGKNSGAGSRDGSGGTAGSAAN